MCLFNGIDRSRSIFFAFFNKKVLKKIHLIYSPKHFNKIINATIAILFKPFKGSNWNISKLGKLHLTKLPFFSFSTYLST